MAGKGGSLGKASLVLTTKDGGLNKGLNKTEGGLKSWASGLKGKVGAALGVVSGLVTGFMGSKLVGNLGELAVTGKQAQALGIASDAYMGLAEAAREAGVEGEQFGTLLQKGQLKITEGSGDTAAALGRIGLSLGELRGLSADEQFYRIADGLAGVSDQGTRALVASKLFEEEGVKLLPVLGRGAAGLRAFVAEQRAMGTALSQTDMDGILSAQAAITRVERRVTGFWNRITAAAAPFIELAVDVADAVLDWLPPFEVVKAAGLAVFRALGVAGAYYWDTVKVYYGAWGKALGFIAEGWGQIIRLMGKAIELGASLPGQTGKDFKAAAGVVSGWGEGIEQWGKGASAWGDRRFGEFGQSAAAVNKWFDNLGKKTGEKLGETAGAKIASAIAAEYRNNPALERGTAEEYSARVRWETMQQTYEQQQAEAAKKTAANTAATAEQLRTLPARIAASIGQSAPLRTV